MGFLSTLSPDGRFSTRSVDPSLAPIGAALALGVFLVGFRSIIILEDLSNLALPEALGALAMACWQDVAVIVGLVLTTLVLERLPGIRRARRLVRGVFYLCCLAILLLGAANIIAVKMLGEPVTLSWLVYSDILHSPNTFDSLTHLADPATVLLVSGSLVAYVAFVLVLTAILERMSPRIRRGLIAAPLVLALFGSVAHALGVSGPSPGKRSNPLVAFGVSLLTEGRLSADLALGGLPSRPDDDLPLAKVPPETRPTAPLGAVRNVIVIALDSTSTKFTQGFEGTYPVTPNLKAYQTIGRRYTRTYIHTPGSNYYLVSMLGGIIPDLSPYSMTTTYPDLQLETLASVLSRRGYRTGFFNSSDNRFQNTDGFAAAAGFETVKDHRDWSCEDGIYESEYEASRYLNTSNDRCTVEPIMEWIGERPQTPFLAMFRTGMTHHPYFPGDNPQHYASDENLNRYLNAVRVADEAVGLILHRLEKMDLLKSTLVVVMGDHGEAFGEHGNYGHAAALYEENVHIPLVFINPLLFSGETSDTILGVSDVAPTILDLLGLPTPRSWQGRSVFTGGRTNAVFMFAPWNGFQVGFVEGTTKFIYNVHRGDQQLFDLTADPGELNNLTEAEAETAERARGILAAFIPRQQAWIDHLLAGTQDSGTEAPATAADTRAAELIVHASGTRFQTPPTVRVSVDGESVVEFRVTLAPANTDTPAKETQIDAALAAYRFTVPASDCAKRLEIEFLNDEWAGENLPGDTNLYIDHVDWKGTSYWPSQFRLATERAGGPYRHYFGLWRKGSFIVDLDLGANCLAGELTAR